jgi:pyridoxal phosphate enzyme (YggS family)
MSFEQRLEAIRERMSRASERAGRALGEVTLVAVTKGHPVDAVHTAMRHGLTVFAENYVQELVAKAHAVAEGMPHSQGIQWRFIGHLQKNKARHVVPVVQVIETVDSLALAQELSKRAVASGRSLRVMLQVNIGREPQKGGCLPEQTEALLDQVRVLPAMDVTGLMAIPPVLPVSPSASPSGGAPTAGEYSRPYFAELRALRDRLGVRELSMGMSDDFEVAIEEGSTHVRIGTALFGPRALRNVR